MSISEDFSVSSMYGSVSNKGLVKISLMGKEVNVMPEKAREMAHMLLESAEAAECDELIMKFAQTDLQLEEKLAVQMLAKLRTIREKNKVEKN